MFDIALVGSHAWDRKEPDNAPAVHRRLGDLPGPDESQYRRWRDALGQTEPIGAIRWDRVNAGRAALASDAYLTDARLEAAIDGLLRDLDA